MVPAPILLDLRVGGRRASPPERIAHERCCRGPGSRCLILPFVLWDSAPGRSGRGAAAPRKPLPDPRLGSREPIARRAGHSRLDDFPFGFGGIIGIPPCRFALGHRPDNSASNAYGMCYSASCVSSCRALQRDLVGFCWPVWLWDFSLRAQARSPNRSPDLRFSIIHFSQIAGHQLLDTTPFEYYCDLFISA